MVVVVESQLPHPQGTTAMALGTTKLQLHHQISLKDQQEMLPMNKNAQYSIPFTTAQPMNVPFYNTGGEYSAHWMQGEKSH